MLLGFLLTAILTYSPPVDYEVSLAGNFAEPRPNHFHGGIDVKTGGVEGKPIFSVADGYVSAASVGIGGYGNALYIKHPDGRTSMYCHLKRFSPQIAFMVKVHQYANKSCRGVFNFTPTDIPVSRGQLVAVSGNSGASQAPHLHLEIHDTRSGDMLDPLDFIGNDVSDGYSPMAHGFMAYPIVAEGSFCGGFAKQSFGFSSHNLTRKFTAWGKVGFGIWANDYMEITYNRYGIRQTELFVDDKLVFKSNAMRIPQADNMQVNAWGDYEHFLRSNVWYMRSYVQAGVTLPIFTTSGGSRGIVDFDGERDYHLKYVLTDFKGNRSTYTFIVHGKPYPFQRKPLYRPLSTLRWDMPLQYRLPGLLLTSVSGSVAGDVCLKPIIHHKTNALSDDYTFMSSPQQLFRYAMLSLRLNKKVTDTSKLYISCRNMKGKFLGGEFSHGWVTGKIRNLCDTYEIASDSEPPVINSVGQNSWNSSHIITIGLSDKDSGVKKFEAYLDGRFILFEDVAKSAWVRCNLKETPVKQTDKMRQLKVIATDNCGNTRTFLAQIKW